MDRHDTHPATAILPDEMAEIDADTWLVPGGEAALALGIAASHSDAVILWQPVDVRHRDAVSVPPPNLRIEAPGIDSGPVDAVALVVPPDRDLARRWLVVAKASLAPGGRLCMAGANAEGIRSIVGDARTLFGPPSREGYRSKQRFADFEARPAPGEEPTWVREPGIAPGTWREFTLDFRGRTVTLVTQAGVFAGDRIDIGTRLLLDRLPELVTGNVLDVGCGAGVIGIAASLLGAGRVDLVDASLLAVQAAAENLRRLELPGCRAFASDVYDALGDTRYDLIVSNPPFHRGKAVDLSVADRLIAGAPAHLAAGGALVLVANAFLAYGKRMARVFRDVETIAATRQYHIIRASAPR